MSFAHDVWNGLLDLVAPRRCPGCDEVLEGPESFCEPCDSLLERRDAGPGVYSFFGPIATAIHRLKYQGRTELAPALGARLVDGALLHAGSVDRVVPVPLHPHRHRTRGFNQACLLAAEAARALGVPLDVRRLERVRDTGPQVGRDRATRQVNVRGAFVARRFDGPSRVLLVDDVVTTGATFDAAEEALRSAGAVSVVRLALAAADRDAL